VHVVQGEEHRAVGRDVRGEPVEAVEDCEGGVGRDPAGLRVRRLEDRARRAAVPESQRSRASGSVSAGSKSWRTTPNGKSRSSSLPRSRSSWASPTSLNRSHRRAAVHGYRTTGIEGGLSDLAVHYAVKSENPGRSHLLALYRDAAYPRSLRDRVSGDEE
jgi:hypothetical protein